MPSIRERTGRSRTSTRHLVTADWNYNLPFGRGRQYLPTANKLVHGLIGGWQLTGLARLTSGLPFAPQVGAGWVTAWYFQTFLVKTGNVPMKKHIIPGAGPEAFADPDKLSQCIETTPTCPIRYPIPGETGSRNAFRGDGFFGIDSGLNKTWHVWERAGVKGAWEVFNVTNTPAST